MAGEDPGDPARPRRGVRSDPAPAPRAREFTCGDEMTGPMRGFQSSNSGVAARSLLAAAVALQHGAEKWLILLADSSKKKNPGKVGCNGSNSQLGICIDGICFVFCLAQASPHLTISLGILCMYMPTLPIFRFLFAIGCWICAVTFVRTGRDSFVFGHPTANFFLGDQYVKHKMNNDITWYYISWHMRYAYIL